MSGSNGKSSRFSTSAQRAALNLLKKISTNGSILAFEALGKLGSKGLENNGNATALELEAAKGISEAYNSDGVSEKVKVGALAKILESSGGGATLNRRSQHEDEAERVGRKDAPDAGAAAAGSEEAYVRDQRLSSFGEMFLPILKGGLLALDALNSKRRRLESEYERLSEEEEKTLEGLESEGLIWEGVLTTLERFICPERATEAPAASEIESESVADNDAVVDTALAVLSCSIASAPEKIWSSLGKVLGLSGRRCLSAALWYSSRGMRSCADAELRVFRACVVGMCENVRMEGVVASLTELGMRVFEETLLLLPKGSAADEQNGDQNGDKLGDEKKVNAATFFSLAFCEELEERGGAERSGEGHSEGEFVSLFVFVTATKNLFSRKKVVMWKRIRFS